MNSLKNIFSRIKHQGQSSLVLAALLAIFGSTSITHALLNQQSAPTIKTTNGSYQRPSSEIAEPVLAISEPVSVLIESIGVQSDLITVGKNPDGTVEVPAGDTYDKAAWYRGSVTPGEKGSTVILGHLDSDTTGPSIFFRLGEVKINDEVRVKRADGKTAIFKIDSVKDYAKEDFPTEDVYGKQDKATLKLITCSGDFNQDSGDYDRNLIVTASFIGLR